MCGCEKHWDPDAPCTCDCTEHEPAATTTLLALDLGGSRIVRVIGDRGDILCLTRCGERPEDVAGLQRQASRLAEILGCPVAVFAGEIEPVALPAKANLGVATTRELLEELRARLDVDAATGEVPRLDYRTSDGRAVGDPPMVVAPEVPS